MRGKELPEMRDENDIGITPAHAGKRFSTSVTNMREGDHPRTCGEKLNHQIKYSAVIGSPPHMRGKASPTASFRSEDRITPAHAGKRASCSCGNTSERDHPRTCGEKFFITVKVIARVGSPPHMRGKVAPLSIWSESGRITPAHAGKSFCNACCLSPSGDHPRTCGEKYWRH